MTASRCPVHEGFDPLAPEFLADPYAVLASLPPEEAPLFYAPSIGYYVLTRYADIELVFRGPQVLRVRTGEAPDSARHRRCRIVSSMLTLSITSAASTSSDTVPSQ